MIEAPITAAIGPPISGAITPEGGILPIFLAPLIGSTDLTKGTGVATFTRALAAYYYDSAQDLLVSALANVARFEADGYLSEISSQNLVLDSIDFDPDGANWANTGVLDTTAFYTSNTTIAPDGNTTADTLEDRDGAINVSFLQEGTVSTLDGVKMVASAYVKKDITQTKHSCIRFITTGFDDFSVGINIATGVVQAMDISDALDRVFSVEVAGYWYFGMVITPGIGIGTGIYYLYPAAWADGDTPYTLNIATQGINIFWGTQIEVGTFPTSTIVNTSSAQTRPADKLTYPVAANLLVNECFGVFEWTPKVSATLLITDVFFGSRVDADDLLWVTIEGTSLIFRKRIAATSYEATITLNYVAGVTYKIGWRLSPVNGVDIWVDTVKGTGDADVTDAVLDTNFGIGTDDDGFHPTTANTKQFKIYQGDPSDSQMEALTR